jgi:hypothetical protein
MITAQCLTDVVDILQLFPVLRHALGESPVAIILDF